MVSDNAQDEIQQDSTSEAAKADASAPLSDGVRPHHYFFSVIPSLLGKEDAGKKLRVRRYSFVRKHLKEENLYYKRLKDSKKCIKEALFKGLWNAHFKPDAPDRTSEVPSADPAEEAHLLNSLLKEQKMHSFERFVSLPILYDCFKEHVDQTEEALNRLEGGLGTIVKRSVIELLFFSFSGGNSDKRARARANCLGIPVRKKTNDKTYRKKTYMGREESGSDTPEERTDATRKINEIFADSSSQASAIKGFQRAHTLPFPGLFSWNVGMMKRTLGYRGIKVEESFEPTVVISPDALRIIRDGEVSQKEKNNAFLAGLNCCLKESDFSPHQKAYCCLLYIRNLYLRVFSEVEFFPDFINQEMDGISEWEAGKEQENYQVNLGYALTLHIHQKKSRGARLGDYFEVSEARAIAKALEISSKPQTSEERFKMLCVLQVLQSLQTPSRPSSKQMELLLKKLAV